ncbi:SgcJ/EcaC family oxidoreductase [Streptosporangium sp. NPDC023615]|uniref:SgcJ/EcaC family oxidoreductase n=1 Tax=Streptosporangium sp. NPDC023615 TaxID=3154794 RepID=UPI00343BB707
MSTPTPTPASADAEIRDLLGRLTEAWNAGDADAYGELFTEDADYVTFFGLRLTGRPAVVEAHRALFEGPLKGSRLTGDPAGRDGADIRRVRPDVAVVIFTGSVTGADAPPDPARDSIVTLVAVHDDAWRFTAFQNTRRTSP